MMKNELIRTRTVVKKSPIHGYGVFAEQNFQRDDIIEECYFLRADSQAIDFIDYYFLAGECRAMVLGDGSIYNHSQTPNALHRIDNDHAIMIVQANRPIKQGEEICISYGVNWFDSRHVIPKQRSWRYKYRSLILMAARFLFVMLLMCGVVTLMNTATQSGFGQVLP